VRDYHSQTSITDASCEDLQALKRTYPPVDSRLNAYYLQTVTRPPSVNGAVGTATGRWCENDPNIILVGSWQAETLAHELGHALSLKHSNAWAEANSPPPPPGSAENLMIDSSISRSTLTTGQVFRINVDDSSRLNKNGVRTGTARPCPDSQTSTPRCPAVTFDVQPK
jgi:hypothetical protein